MAKDMTRRRVAIVEWECLTSLGLSAEETWRNAAANQSGAGNLDRYVPEEQTLQGVSKIPYAAQIPQTYHELAGSEAKLKKWVEPAHHAVKTLTLKLMDKIQFDISHHDPQRIAMLGGTALTSGISQDVVNREQQADPKFMLNQCHNMPLAVAASKFGLQGPSFSISGACASSGHALFIAYQFIRQGLIDSAVVLGFEFPVLAVEVAGFEWLNTLYRRDQPDDRAWDDPALACRPFSVDRRGLVLGEGAGAILISSDSYARAHGWPVQGHILGGCANSDADHITKISIDNTARCMTSAIRSAGVAVDSIDCVNTHGTSTFLGDRSELGALAKVFGSRLEKLPVVANKSQIGHTLGASSILETILAMKGMQEKTLLPTLNHVPDPELPKAVVAKQAEEYRHRTTLMNSFGFGGTNVSILLECSMN